MMKLTYACLAPVLAMALSGCATQHDPVRDAIEFGVHRNDPETSLLSVDAVAGDYARVTVSGGGRTETEYLERHDGYWLVEARGTRIDPYTLGMPKKVVDALMG